MGNADEIGEIPFEPSVLLPCRYHPELTTRLTASLISAPCAAVTLSRSRNLIILYQTLINITYNTFARRVKLYNKRTKVHLLHDPVGFGGELAEVFLGREVGREFLADVVFGDIDCPWRASEQFGNLFSGEIDQHERTDALFRL